MYNNIAVYKVYSGLCILYDITEVYKVFISMLLVSGYKYKYKQKVLHNLYNIFYYNSL